MVVLLVRKKGIAGGLSGKVCRIREGERLEQEEDQGRTQDCSQAWHSDRKEISIAKKT